MASLISLPNELKDFIFEHLSCADFVSLSSTCRDLHAIALPLAYRHLSLTWVNANVEAARTPKLPSLLRTLIQRPDYAKLITHLAFGAERCIFFEDYNEFQSYGDLKVSVPGSEVALNEEGEALLRRALTEMGLSGDKSWTDAVVGHQQFFVVLAMVVACCAKLESLVLSVAFLLQNDWFEESIEKGVAGGSGLSTWTANLKHLRITCNTNGYEWTPGCMQVSLQKAFLYPFYLPKLETLEIERFEGSYDPVDWQIDHEDYATPFWPVSPTSPPVAGHLTTLRLLRSSASSEALELLLKQTPNLRIFELDIVADTPLTHELVPFDFNALKASLDRLQTTLTHLKIRFEKYLGCADYEYTLDEWAIGALGSFRKYPALTHLEVSLHVLFDLQPDMYEHLPSLAAVLPPNLHSLTITDDLWMMAEYQEAFEDIEAMAIFRRYLTGEQLPHDWQDRKDSFGFDIRRRFLAVTWVPGATEGEWKTATPRLKRFVYDLRKKGYLSREYWNKGMIRRQFRMMCREQGLEGEVLWEKIQYY